MCQRKIYYSFTKGISRRKIYTSNDFDFKADFPRGTILIPEEINYSLVNSIYKMYSTDESMENGQSLLVGMYTEDIVFRSMLEDCKEVHDVNI